MNETNRGLLEKVIEEKLRLASDSTDETEKKEALDDALKAIEKQTAIYKIDVGYQEHVEAIDKDKNIHQSDEMFKRNEANKDRKVQIAIFAAGLVATPAIEVICKTIYANKICKLEQFETFTSSAGRGIASWFKWKK